MGWVEVADAVWVRRYASLDVNVGVVRGAAGLVVVDTRCSHVEADELRRDLRELGDLPVHAVVNTHAHFDHTFGNARFGPTSDLDVPILGHERLPAHLQEFEERMLAGWVAAGEGPAPGIVDVVLTQPSVLVGDRSALDLGDREVELLHLGRGHTDHDLLLHVPAADAWLVGDLVEASGPPMYGSGSCPLDWPTTAAALLDALEPGAVVVPGHGDPVDAAFVAAQQRELATVAGLVRELHGSGVPAGAAVATAAGRWPFPDEVVVSAVRDGYAQLG